MALYAIREGSGVAKAVGRQQAPGYCADSSLKQALLVDLVLGLLFSLGSLTRGCASPVSAGSGPGREACRPPYHPTLSTTSGWPACCAPSPHSPDPRVGTTTSPLRRGDQATLPHSYEVRAPRLALPPLHFGEGARR